jgi:hypothetical protein
MVALEEWRRGKEDRDHTALLRDHTALLRDCTTPLRDRTTLLRDHTALLRDCTTPLRDRTTPLRDRTTPLRDCTTPLRDHTALRPHRNRTALYCRLQGVDRTAATAQHHDRIAPRPHSTTTAQHHDRTAPHHVLPNRLRFSLHCVPLRYSSLARTGAARRPRPHAPDSGELNVVLRATFSFLSHISTILDTLLVGIRRRDD